MSIGTGRLRGCVSVRAGKGCGSVAMGCRKEATDHAGADAVVGLLSKDAADVGEAATDAVAGVVTLEGACN